MKRIEEFMPIIFWFIKINQRNRKMQNEADWKLREKDFSLEIISSSQLYLTLQT